MIRLSLAGYLGAALALSLGLNTWQVYRSGKGASELSHQTEVCELNGQIAGLEANASKAEAIAGMKIADTAELLGDLSEIADRGQQVRTRYLQAATAAPLPTACAPGPARVDTINRHLGPAPEEK